MPEIKNTFLGGKMNKDLDERLLPKDQMRDALNIEVSTSQGDDVGSLQNSWGNTAHSDLSRVIPGAKCIGSFVDKENDKLYWFISGDNTDAIVEYDAKLRLTVPVLVDFGMEDTYTQTFGSIDVNPNSSLLNVIDHENVSSGIAWTNSVPNATSEEGISWNLAAFSGAAIYGRAGYLYLFRDEVNFVEGYTYEVEYEVTLLSSSNLPVTKLELSNHGKNNTNITLDISSNGIKKTRWIQGGDNNYLLFYQDSIFASENVFTIKNIKVTQIDRFLNFNSVNHITGINVLDGMLIWTDGETEPKKINIERCKAGSNRVVNFNATSFVGPELLSNTEFTSDSNWSSDPEWDITSGPEHDSGMESISPVPQWKRFYQTGVSIKRGKTYTIDMDITGTLTTGKIGVVIVDEHGGWTKPRSDQFITTTGLHTFTLTAGTNDDNSESNLDAGYVVSQFYVQNEDSIALNSGVIIESISIKEIAFDWNTTTKIKNASGIYTRNVKEEDITLIKKYPLNAPDMELINTNKPQDSVIKTSCTTPTNTTKGRTIGSTGEIAAFSDGSGDTIRYNSFLHMYLRRDAVINRNSQDETIMGNTTLMQLDVGPDWSSMDSSTQGNIVDYPLFVVENDPISEVLTLPGSLESAPINYSTGFTLQSDYYKKAWQAWCSTNPYVKNAIWCIDTSGQVAMISSAALMKDFIGGRIYLDENTSELDVANNENFWKQGQRIVLGYLDLYNNNSFWTYRDGSGVLKAKPAGVSSDEPTFDINGNVLLDDDTGEHSIIPNATKKLADFGNDFGGGWTAVNGKYIGNAFTSTATTTHPTNLLSINVLGSGDGWQYLHNFVTGLEGGRIYLVKFKLLVVTDVTSTTLSAFGVSGIDALTGNSIGTGNAIGEITGNSSGTIINFNKYIKVGEESDGDGLGLSFFKRNGCECEISNIQVVDTTAAPLTIQPLVFSPKPDYITGDLVKLTNSNKAPNGDDVTVTVKLKSEIPNGSLLHKTWGRVGGGYFVNAVGDEVQAPISWSDGIVQGGDMVNDSDFKIPSANSSELSGVQALGNLTFAGGTTALNSTSTNTADWTTSLEMVENGLFTGNADTWSINAATGGTGLGIELFPHANYEIPDGPNLVDMSQSSLFYSGGNTYIYNPPPYTGNYYGRIDSSDYDSDVHGAGYDVQYTGQSSSTDGRYNLVSPTNLGNMVDGDEYILSYEIRWADWSASTSSWARIFGVSNHYGLQDGQGQYHASQSYAGHESGGTSATSKQKWWSFGTSTGGSTSSTIGNPTQTGLITTARNDTVDGAFTGTTWYADTSTASLYSYFKVGDVISGTNIVAGTVIISASYDATNTRSEYVIDQAPSAEVPDGTTITAVRATGSLSTTFTFDSQYVGSYPGFQFMFGNKGSGQIYDISIRKKGTGPIAGITISDATAWTFPTATTAQAGTGGDLEIAMPGVVDGTTYRISYDITTASTAGTGLTLIGAATGDVDVDLPGTAIGSYTVDWTQGTTNAGKIILNCDGVFDGTIGLVSVKEVLVGEFGHPKYGTDNIELVYSTVAGANPSVKQTSEFNNRLFFEKDGEYKYSFDYIQIVSGTGGGDAAAASDATGWGLSISNGLYFENVNTSTGNTDVTTLTTKTDTFTFDHSTTHGLNPYSGDIYKQRDKGEIRFTARTYGDLSRQLDSGTIDNVSLKANNDANRITWGDDGTAGAVIIAGTTSQIIQYPANPTGAKVAGSGTFELTAGSYYRMQYQIQNTNYVDQATTPNCTIRLFDHDHIMRSVNQSGLFPSSSSNDGSIYLDVTNGYHSVYWQQSYTKNQLEIAIGPGFAGTINNVEVFPLTITDIEYGDNGSNADRKIFEAEIVSIDNNITQLPISEHRYWNCELVDEEPLFKRVFPRFAYRWKYDDGEYSAISAFTEVAFLPDEDYRYNAIDGYNLSMENTVRRIILSKFDTMPSGVAEIEILYKESNSNNIYTFTNIKGAELQDFTKLEINREKFHALVESKQLLRPYDNVPRKAVAQEISSNRIIFGNYTQQYDISPSDEPVIAANLHSETIAQEEEVAKSIKSIREYQIGISYLDMFGRQSPIFSVDSALVSIDQKFAKSSNSITATLQSFPPDWVTHYKYFVKDSAATYYNISLDRYYQAENSNHVWMSFPSSDFNKLDEDDYLILKKEHDSSVPLVEDRTVKYKVLAKRSSAPEFIKMTRKIVGGRIFNDDKTGLHFASQSSYGGSIAGYPLKDKITFRLRGDIVHGNAALLEALLDNQTGRYIRIGQAIPNKPSLFSNYYEILHISRVNNADTSSAGSDSYAGVEDYYEFTLVEPLSFDAAFVGSNYSSSRVLFLEYYREELNEYDNNFEGKFFIKIAKDSNFEKYIGSKQKIEDTGFNVVNSEDTYWAFAWENNSGKNTRTDRGQDTDMFLRDRVNNFNWKTTDLVIFNNIPTDGVYVDVNGVTTAVKRFPPLMNKVQRIQHVTRTNPYIGTWEGTVHGNTLGNTGTFNVAGDGDWNSLKDGETELSQRFCIYQAFSWNYDSNWPSYTGMDTDIENSRIGNGFVMGNNYCSFAFSGIGEVDMGTDDALGGGAATNTEPDPAVSAVDTNTWFDEGDQDVSPEFFNNFPLAQQMIEPGTKFRWGGDPSQTVYTIKKVVRKAAIFNYDRRTVGGFDYGKDAAAQNNYTLKKDKSVFGYRVDLELDKAIVWSPTATIVSGFGYNANNTHTPLVPFSAGVPGTTSQIHILEKRPNEITTASFNPAVFEVEPKERVDLNLYHESAECSIVLKEGMYIEALNNIHTNDFTDPNNGGNYSTTTDHGTIYKPAGNTALPYIKLFGDENILNSGFEEEITDSWTLDTVSGFTSTHDATNFTLKLAKLVTGAEPSLTTTYIVTLEDTQKYQLVVDVESLDNDINGLGSPPDTFVQVRGWDGSAYTAYYPLSGSTPPLQQGLNIFEFTHDSSTAGASHNQAKVAIVLNDPTQAYAKEIVLNSVSLKTLTIDETSPVVKIKTGKKYDWCDTPNKIKIDNSTWSSDTLSTQFNPGEDLPSGITLRISQIDSGGNIDFYKDYILPIDVNVGEETVITLPPEKVKWHNCFSFGNGVESDRLRDDFNAVTIDKGPRVSTTLEESYKEQTRGGGLIFSGIYNSTSGVNQLNQFIAAENITKDLNPDYGTIQKLFTRNTNVVALCEDKILKVLVDKDALFNADGGMQITASSKVLGQAIPFEGEYGISRNPESFANFGYRIYFTDRDRGAVLRLSNDGLTPISEHDMISYFKYKLPNSNTMIGSYDENRDLYNLTLEDITVSFSEAVTGWTSFKSFLPESGASINGDYFTWKNGDLWKHHSNALRNNFYSAQYESSVKLVLNASAEAIKNYETLNYEGTSSRAYEKTTGEENQLITKGWYADSITTDLETAKVVDFKEKEGKWFSNITGTTVTEENILPKRFTSQGLGFVGSVSAGDHPNYKTLLISTILPDSIPNVNCIGAGSGLLVTTTYSWDYPTGNTHIEDVLNSTTKIQVRSATQIDWESHVNNGTISQPSFYYATGIVDNLINGNKYYIEAEIENFSGSSVSAGFSAANMVDVDASKLTLQGNGKISTFFVYDDNKYDPITGSFGGGVSGIHFAKQGGSSGTIKNIKCVNVTSKIDNIKYTVNTSETDRTQTNSEIKTNEKVGVNSGAITKHLYIHSKTVSGIKYAVTSGKFTAISSNPAITISPLQNIGTGTNSPGYYGNVVKVTITIDYNSGNLFPNENVESYINISGSTALAIDQ